MTPPGTRARADELARLLDGGVGAGPGSQGSAVALVERLRATGTALQSSVDPEPVFRGALRQRLVAIATVRAASGPPAPAPAREPLRVHRSSRGASLVAAALAAVVLVTGVGVASSRSLPGDPLYAAKRATEGLQLRTADGALGRGARQLHIASTRLEEVRVLALGRGAVGLAGSAAGAVAASVGFTGADHEQRITATLLDMDQASTDGANLLDRAWRKSGQPEALELLSSWAKQQGTGIAALVPQLPPAAAAQAQSSLELVTVLRTGADRNLAQQACALPCGPVTGPQGSVQPRRNRACPCPSTSAPPVAGGSPTPSSSPAGPATASPSLTAAPGPSAGASTPPGLAPTPSAAATDEPSSRPAPSRDGTPSTGPTATSAPDPTPNPETSTSPSPAEQSPEPSPTDLVPVPSLTPVPSEPVEEASVLPAPLAT